MTRQRFAILATAVAFFVLVVLSTTAGDPKGGDYWVFVTAYLLVAAVAVACRRWVAAATAAAVAVVRGMVALHIVGVPFEVASSAFAALFLLLVMQVADDRRAP